MGNFKVHKLLISIFILSCLTLNADYKLYLDFTVNDSESLIQLDEALKVGHELKKALKNLAADSSKASEYNELQKKLEIYEAEMLKVYGIYPGLTYQMVPTSGYIFNLIPEVKRDEYLDKGFKIPVDSPSVIIKDKKNQEVKCLKVKVKFLQRRESVMQFNQALKTAHSIRQQIQNLETQLAKKPELKDKESIQEGMTKLKDTLKSIELKMNEKFDIRNDGKYIFKPKAGAVYLALDKEDLKKLSLLKQASKK